MKYINEDVLNTSISHLHTEQRNERTKDFADVSPRDMLLMMNREDRTVADRVYDAIPQIAAAIEYILPRMEKGGRVVYCGAGTSARLGYLDAAECPPTFGVAPDVITCLMAGGKECVFRAKEMMEDSKEDAVNNLKAFGLTPLDTVIAVAASGRTPYGIGALEYAGSIGAGKVSIACNPDSEQGKYADVAIDVDTGAEVLMGSTRLKAGTAQKLVMNMLSTCLMTKLGRTCGNVLVGGPGANSKISNRRVRALSEAISNPDLAYCKEKLEAAGGCARCAAIIEFTGITVEEAKGICDTCDNNFHEALRRARDLRC